MTYLLLMSAPCSNRNKALTLSPLLTALCSSVRPLVVCTSILAPASSSLLATDICPVHRASSKVVWSSLSDKLKSGTMGRRPPLPRLPVTWICNLFNDQSYEILTCRLLPPPPPQPFTPYSVQFKMQKESEIKVLHFHGIFSIMSSKSPSFYWASISNELTNQGNE